MKNPWAITIDKIEFTLNLFRNNDYYYVCVTYQNAKEVLFVDKIVYRGKDPRGSSLLLIEIRKRIMSWLLKHKLSAKTLKDLLYHIVEIDSVEAARTIITKMQEQLAIAKVQGGQRHVFIKSARHPFGYVNIRFSLL